MMHAIYEAINRRQLMQQALLLIGASNMPVDAALSLTQKHRKRFFAAAHAQLLIALADTILPATDTPGALAVGVPARFDAMVQDWASAETKNKIIGALDRIDAAAKAATHKSFTALLEAERAAFLRPYDAAALVKQTPPADAPRPHPLAPRHWVVDDGYLMIKQLILSLYYTSEIAMTQELIYEHVPGEWQASIKITKASRPWASIGLF
jgi:gluconate 2-dehydrogenase gamma chain